MKVSEIRFCERCGGSRKEGDRFCVDCGVEFPIRASNDETLPSIDLRQDREAPSSTPPHAGSTTPLLGESIPDDALRGWAHPLERRRVPLAVLGAVPLIIIAILASVFTFGGFLIAFLVGLWLTGRITEARLRGGAVVVSKYNFPEIAEQIEILRARLGYPKEVRAFVVQDGAINALLWRVFGRKYLALNTGLVESMTAREREFVIARFMGTLRSGHLRFHEVAGFIEAFDNLWGLNLLVVPYLRATVYTGDRVGLMTCGSFEACRSAFEKLMLGPKLSSKVSMSGLLEQAQALRTTPFRVLAILFSSHPHMTDRYWELFSFAQAQGFSVEERQFDGSPS
jgi:Zn-dependent protease with chaperone function